MTETLESLAGRPGTDRVRETCGRCGGDGLYHGPTNARWENGSGNGSRPYCFYCGGAGATTVLVSSLRARIRRQEKAAAEAQAANEAARIARAAWESAGYGDLMRQAETVADGMRDGDPLKRDLRQAIEGLNFYSAGPAEADAVHVALDAVQARMDSATPVPEGKVEVTGTVRSVQWRENGFGGAWKMLVECDGFKVWGTRPAALSEAESGDVVTFTATCERSSDDPAFGFFSRPSKARMLEPVG